MKIVFTGGGTGGHFYPIIAVAEEINHLADEKKLVDVELFYFSDSPYDERALFENQITFKKVSAGRRRVYGGIVALISNFFDLFKTAIGIIKAIATLYSVYPDVVFGKGGYASFPTLFAARFLRIPVIIHDSDTIPGRVNLWAKKFAKKIAIAHPDAAKYFPEEKTALVGVPIRRLLKTVTHVEAAKYLGLDENIPTILVLGGSSGAKRINQLILDSLSELVVDYQVIHQTGKGEFHDVENMANVILEKSPFKDRYKPFQFLSEAGMKQAAGLAKLIVSRAGSTSIFEIASWKKPSIVIPIPESISRDQTRNAVAYSRTGAATLMEEGNLTPHLLIAEIKRILSDEKVSLRMSQSAEAFAKPDAAKVIAEEILRIAISHEE